MGTNITQITWEQLEEGIIRCSHQIRYLLESADLLIEKRKYVTAIGLIVLAQEESSRKRIFHLYKKNKKSITNTEWKEMLDHKNKLTFTYRNSKESLSKKSPEKIIAISKAWNDLGFSEKLNLNDIYGEVDEMQINTLESLDLLKQDCFYTNYLENEKQWFSTLGNLSIEQQKAIAISLYVQSKTEYHMMQIAQKFNIINIEQLEKLKKDQNMIEIKKLNKLKMSPNYKKMKKISEKIIQLKFANRQAIKSLQNELKHSKNNQSKTT